MENEYIYSLEEPIETDHNIAPFIYWLLGAAIGYALGKSSCEK